MQSRTLHGLREKESTLAWIGSKVNFVLLTFSDQKNAVRGERIGHSLSGHPLFCPVNALIRRCRHLQAHRAPSDTPLCAYFAHRKWHSVTSLAITTFLRAFVAQPGQPYGLSPSHVTVRSLRPSGAMALLQARIDDNVIRLIGRWQSDTMLRYLHAQSTTLMSPFAAAMNTGTPVAFRPINPPGPPNMA